MRRALERLRRLVSPGQLELRFAPPAMPGSAAPKAAARPKQAPRSTGAGAADRVTPPNESATVLHRLRVLGLRDIRRCALTRNRSTMVSFRGDALRVHHAFTTAPEEVLQAIVAFVNGRGATRRAARRTLAAFDVPRDPEPALGRRPAGSHPEDAALAARLRAAHGALNAQRFAGALRAVSIRVSRRMRSRLGHYSPGLRSEPEVAIARRHVRRDGWESVLETLLHEMVHQWQHETGRPIAHDAAFRRKCREVGIAPRAKRPY